MARGLAKNRNNGPAQPVSGNEAENEYFDASEQQTGEVEGEVVGVLADGEGEDEGDNVFYDAEPQLKPIGLGATSGDDIDIDKNLKLYNSITELLESGQILLTINAQLRAESPI